MLVLPMKLMGNIYCLRLKAGQVHVVVVYLPELPASSHLTKILVTVSSRFWDDLNFLDLVMSYR